MPKWQEPIRTAVAVSLLVSVAFCPQPPTQAATVPQGWNEPQPQLVAVRPVAQASIAYDFQPPPALPVTPTQFGFEAKQAAPVLLAPRALDPQIAFAAQPPPSLPVTPAQVGWLQKWQDPVRLPLDYDDPVFVFATQPAPNLPVTPSTLLPAAQLALPTLRAPRTTDPAIAWAPQPVAAAIVQPPWGWFALWQEPVRVAARAVDPVFAWNARPAPSLPVTPTQWGFEAKVAAPVLLPPRALDPQVAWDAQFIAPFAFSAPFGWDQQQFGPVLLPARAVDPQLAYNYRPAPVLPVTPSQLAFWTPMHEIVRTPDRRDNAIAWTPQPIVTIVIPQGWKTSEFSPLLLRSRATESPLAWTPRPLALPVTPSQLGFWQPFHEIVRTPLRGDVASPYTPAVPVSVSPCSSFLVTLVGKTSGVVITFTLPKNPVPDFYSQGVDWILANDVVFKINGISQPAAQTMQFVNAVLLGGAYGLINSVGQILVDVMGAQIYSGTEQNPLIQSLGPLSMALNASGSPFYNEDFEITIACAGAPVGWLLNGGASAIPLLVSNGVSAVPALVCYQGYVLQNEAGMSVPILQPLQIAEPFILYPGNTIPVFWSLIDGTTWNTTQTPVTDATGTLSIYDPDGVVVPGADAIAFSPTTTPGTYMAQIPGAGFSPDEGINYQTVITFSSPTVGGPGLWTIPTKIRYRTTP